MMKISQHDLVAMANSLYIDYADAGRGETRVRAFDSQWLGTDDFHVAIELSDGRAAELDLGRDEWGDQYVGVATAGDAEALRNGAGSPLVEYFASLADARAYLDDWIKAGV